MYLGPCGFDILMVGVVLVVTDDLVGCLLSSQVGVGWGLGREGGVGWGCLITRCRIASLFCERCLPLCLFPP